MARVLLPLLLFFSLANAELITVECSDGKAQFERADLLGSKCLKITQSLRSNSFPSSNVSLKKIDSKLLKLFIKLSKLNDAKKFAFIDSLSPDAFQLFDHYANYLCTYQQYNALFQYKYLKEYGFENADSQLQSFVSRHFYIENPFRIRGYFEGAMSPFFSAYFRNYETERIFVSNSNDSGRAFFVLLDFYKRTLKKPLPISSTNLKNIFESFDPSIQDFLIQQNLVIR